jgi:predicted nucleic acid-binding protein
VDAEGASVERALSGDCIADTSLLSNFVNTGYADLLDRLLGKPVFLSPSVLDEWEAIPPLDSLDTEPASEFLRPLYMSQFPGNEAYEPWSPHIRAFASGKGTAWQPATLTASELALASSFRNKRIRTQVRRRCPDVRGRIELDVGEAEAAAVAISRSFTFLVDDGAAVQLVRCLYPEVTVLRTCGLLAHAVEKGYLPCDEAADLFNCRLAREMGFYASRKEDGARQYLQLRCSPPRCVWE